MRRARLARGVLAGYVVALCLALLSPMVVIVMAGFSNDSFLVFPPHGYSFRWIDQAIHDPLMVPALTFSLELSAGVAIISTLIGVAAALALNRMTPGWRRPVLGIIFAPMMIPHIVLAVGLLEMFSVTGISTSPLGLGISQVLITLPFVLRLVIGGISEQDMQLATASRTLGASPVQTFWRISLPLMRAGIIAGFIFAFLLAFDETDMALFMSRPGATTLPVQLYEEISQVSSPIVASFSTLILLALIVILGFIEWRIGIARLISGDLRVSRSRSEPVAQPNPSTGP